jgi:formylglycine-generating enzyme required for sulfatase activity
MHGNATEWTSSDFDATRKVVRGGSFHDRPFRATAYSRWGYPTWQRVWNVGFRVVCEDVLDEANGPRRGKGAAKTSDTK